MFWLPLLLIRQAPTFDQQMLLMEVRMGGGRLGVAIRDLQTGKTIAYRAREHFPMQSVFKLPLGIAVLDAVDRGVLSLDKPVLVDKSRLSVPMSVINERFRGRTATYRVRDLLDLAVGTSDNTAADLLLELLGGPSAVSKRLWAKGLHDIQIDRLERQLQLDYAGIPRFTPSLTTEAGFKGALAIIPNAAKVAALTKYVADRRDTATPLAMVGLLANLQSGKLLSPASTRLLLGIMSASTTGPHRLKAGLPKGTSLAHKTGTGREIGGICGALNDVGIATLPGGRKVAIAVFLAGTRGTTPSREKVIADVARLAASKHL